MSTDQQPASYDPRYDGIYQRGGAASTQPDVEPRHDAAEEPWTATTTTASFAHEQRRVDAPAPAPETASDSAIREVGAPPGTARQAAVTRNPYDVWVWLAAALLTGLGIYFLSAPIISAEEYAEQMMMQSGSSMYINPWYNYTINIAPTLILLGLGSAVVQVFILSIRHTLRSR